MMKIKQIQILQLVRKFTLCKLGLHVVATIIENRPRYKSKYIRSSFSYGTSKFTHYVQGYYDKCICCGKKFSNFKRIRNYEKANNMR